MSYDVDIGGNWFNYTWNLGPMFRDHMHDGIPGLDGLTGKQAAAVLGDALNAIDRTMGQMGEHEFRAKYDAANGWGSAFGGVLFLVRIYTACVANPRKKVSVS